MDLGQAAPSSLMPRGNAQRFVPMSLFQSIGVYAMSFRKDAMLAEGVYKDSFKTSTSVPEAIANQLVGAANYDVQTYAISQKEEKERVAAAAR